VSATAAFDSPPTGRSPINSNSTASSRETVATPTPSSLAAGDVANAIRSATSAHLSPEALRSSAGRPSDPHPSTPLLTPFRRRFPDRCTWGTADDHEPISGSEKPPPPLSATPRVQPPTTAPMSSTRTSEIHRRRPRVAIAVDVLLTELPRPLITASPTRTRNAVGTNLVLKVLVTSLAALRR
jgi:hypothetical protein